MRLLTVLTMFFVLFVVASGPVFCDEQTQTDWSDGYGVPGPVSDWENAFDLTTATDWAHNPGDVKLDRALPHDHTITSSSNEPAGAAVGDFDGDGNIDVAAVAFAGDEVAWWRNDGSGGGWAKTTIATSYTAANSLCAEDIDDDGDTDIAACAENDHTISWWKNDGSGGGWAQIIVDDDINGPFSIQPADFDDDGDTDLCNAAFYAGQVNWYENTDGTGNSWQKHSVDSSFSGAWWAVPSDIDDDNDYDIVGASYSTDDIVWWENVNAAGWSEHVVDGNFDAPVNVRAGDVDNDGDNDIVAASYTTNGEISWWENDGSGGGWQKRIVADRLDGPWTVRFVDIDDDNDLDVLGNERDANRVIWWENIDTAGHSWLGHIVDEVSEGSNDVLTGYIDNDTELDIIGTFSWDNSILWYAEATDYADSGNLTSSILDMGGFVNDWGIITWGETVPSNTSITVDIRASVDPGDMGNWTTVTSPGDDLSNYIDDGTRYFQYGITLSTTNVNVSPVFEEISINWDYIGIEDEENGTIKSFGLYRPKPNPSQSGSSTIGFALPRPCDVKLELYDIKGRKIATLAEGLYQPGEYFTDVNGLGSGIYLYRLESGDFEATRKMVVK